MDELTKLREQLEQTVPVASQGGGRSAVMKSQELSSNDLQMMFKMRMINCGVDERRCVSWKHLEQMVNDTMAGNFQLHLRS